MRYLIYIYNGIVSEQVIHRYLDVCDNELLGLNKGSVNPHNNNNLNPFIALFNKSGTHYSYLPSYFLPSKINPIIHDFNLLEYILYQQYSVLSTHSIITKEYVDGLHTILNQYNNINERLITNYKGITF